MPPLPPKNNNSLTSNSSLGAWFPWICRTCREDPAWLRKLAQILPRDLGETLRDCGQPRLLVGGLAAFLGAPKKGAEQGLVGNRGDLEILRLEDFNSLQLIRKQSVSSKLWVQSLGPKRAETSCSRRGELEGVWA